jgi:hypothetical protein
MSRSNSRSGTGRRKPGADAALNPMLLDDTVTQRVRGKNSEFLKSGPAGEPDVMPDVDAMLDKQAARDMQENGIARRRIEMLREDRWLQQQLAESYDP